ncbi:Retrotransposon protein, Ty3-gypsy subclass [Phytophthora megakarya]|uniref:Retrotransposon protein, Ty3-gypsy subclass n=1 Tax=Phytophthora megakarya TaxID=4795 RepID=A0A225WTF0_9STRA|nr:Retrotransposon protein, Ty3-gypsy subclass [Phytophthora megakarya]
MPSATEILEWSCLPVCEVVRSLSTNDGPEHETTWAFRSQPIPRGRWTNLAMNFMVGLPQTPSKHDSVLVVVDQFTKRAHCPYLVLPYTRIVYTLYNLGTHTLPPTCAHTTGSASNTAELIRDYIFVLHGIPAEILSDRDPKFTSTLSTAFRHQVNDVTERLNQTIEN